MESITSNVDSRTISPIALSDVSTAPSLRGGKKRKRPARPVTQLAYGVHAFMDHSGNTIISNPHDVSAVYMSRCFGKGSLSKGVPIGCIDNQEELILSPCETFYLLKSGAIKVF